jgi:hypothetical protein
MKIRSGFVSNSSSSSFIIAINDKMCTCPTCGRRDKNIFDIIERNSSGYYDETRVKAVGAKEVIDYITDNWYDSERNKELIEKIKAAGDAGKYIGLIDISYHDELSNDEYNSQLERGVIEELYSCR